MRLLPSRYTPEVNERVIREAARMLAEAAASGRPRGRPRAAVAAVLFPLLALGGLGFLGRREDPTSRVNFDRSSVISADATGTSAKLQDFISGQSSEEEGTPPGTAAPLHPGPPGVGPRRGPRMPKLPPAPMLPQAATTCTDCGQTTTADVASMEVLFDESGLAGAPAPALATPSSLVVNVGTRMPIVLTHDVLTGTGPAPVTARIERDLVVGDRVALPQGTLVVGEGVSVDESDRVQVVFSALVVDGKTVPLQGLVLGLDDDLGLTGKLIRKASKSKKGMGRVLGALGGAASTLSFGLLGTRPDLAELTAAELAQEAGRDAQGVSRQWSVSDKAVRLEAGTRGILYLRADLKLP